MSEWWTYRLSSFLMFSPKTYWRLIEQYNLDMWPAHLVAILLGLTVLWLAAQRRAGMARVMAALLAAVWLWVGWAFHWQHYASINWAARYFALAFALQAALLLGLGNWPRDAHAPAAGVGAGAGAGAGAAAQKLGWLLAVGGVLLYPLAGPLVGRPCTQVELFGMAPEPTALATLGLLLASASPPSKPLRWLLATIPALSLLVGAATLWLIAGG
jgi:Family of unknown function (DUF6064)